MSLTPDQRAEPALKQVNYEEFPYNFNSKIYRPMTRSL